MSVKVKICGVKNPDILQTAVTAGADFIGLVFYLPSPRAVTPSLGADLARMTPASTRVVGLFVDPDEALLEQVMSQVPLDYIQLHGKETPDRTAEIRDLYGLPVIKAIPVARRKDLLQVRPYHDAADIILFDAKPPDNVVVTLPGGTGIAFDWSILSGIKVPMPWMLAGGLNPDNVADAITTTRAEMVDVSSGVETGPGLKDPQRIKTFIERAKHDQA